MLILLGILSIGTTNIQKEAAMVTLYQQLHTDPRKPLPSLTASPQEDFANAGADTLVLDMTVSESNKTHPLRTSLSPYNVMLHTNV